MTDDLTRLTEGQLDERVRQVLDAGRADAPSHRSARITARALGLSGSLADVAHAASHAGVAAGKSTLPWFVKWIGVGVLAGGVAGGGAFVGFAPQTRASVAADRQAPPDGARAAAPVRAAPPVSPGGQTPRTEVSRGVTETPSSTASTRAPAAGGRRASPMAAAGEPRAGAVGGESAPARAGTLGEEVALLDRAREALRSGDPAGALTALERYDATRSERALRNEALLLRVRALLQAGRGGEACSLAHDYIARRPNDGYAARLSRLCTPQAHP